MSIIVDEISPARSNLGGRYHDVRVERVAQSLVAAGLITQGDDAQRHFQAAMAVDGLGERPFQLARTELAYGDWLRRSRRRADARPACAPPWSCSSG